MSKFFLFLPMLFCCYPKKSGDKLIFVLQLSMHNITNVGSNRPITEEYFIPGNYKVISRDSSSQFPKFSTNFALDVKKRHKISSV